MSARRGECMVCGRTIALHGYGALRRHGFAGPCAGSGKHPTPLHVRDAVIPSKRDDVAPWVADMAKLRDAIVRLLCKSIADDAECTCEDDHEGGEDTCPECEAMRALGLGDWPGSRKAEKLLGTVKR